MQLKIWETAKESNNPLLIFIAGYLNETTANSETEGWAKPCIEYAKEQGYSVGLVYWKSQSLFDLIPQSLSIFDIATTGVKSFTRAKEKADSEAQVLANYLTQIQRPIILVGHSLGARIAIKVAECITFKLKALVLLAAAIEENSCNLDKVYKNVIEKPIVCYSKNDMVLSYLYSFAKNPKLVSKTKSVKLLGLVNQVLENSIAAPPIGLVGVSNIYRKLYACYDLSPLSHQQYAVHLKSILERVMK